MKSIKNAFVFLVMLGVVYGVWQMLNKKPIAPPAGMLDGVVWNPPKLDFSSGQVDQALVGRDLWADGLATHFENSITFPYVHARGG